MTNLYADIHVIQSVPAANVNRDDTGAPKTVVFGGVVRSRVSSQSWKRAMRLDFAESGTVPTGSRTVNAPTLLAEAIKNQASALSDEEALEKAIQVFQSAGIKLDKDNQTKALLLISHGQVNKLAEYALAHDVADYDKKALKAVFNGDQSLDLALFGRMVADNPELNVEAASQVAHAVSTHEMTPEFDYFTALDDLRPDETAGATMLGTVEYNSATLYRYANVNINELTDNLGQEAMVMGLGQFIRSFVLSMPSGKQNTFANKTLPSYVLVVLRPDTPVNLATAFEQPIRSNNGYVEASIDRLIEEYEKTQNFVDTPTATYALGQRQEPIGTQVASLNELVDQVTTTAEQVIADEDINN